jgi:hypothetical protein
VLFQALRNEAVIVKPAGEERETFEKRDIR